MKSIQRGFFLLTDNRSFRCNVKESELAMRTRIRSSKSERPREAHLACEAVVVSAQIESDLIDLPPEEAAAYLKELACGIGLGGSSGHISCAGSADVFTFNDKEVRAWTIHAGDTASRAAGTIHTI